MGSTDATGSTIQNLIGGLPFSRSLAQRNFQQRAGLDATSEKRFAAWLFVAVFASRALTSTSAYFGDANRYLGAIENHT